MTHLALLGIGLAAGVLAGMFGIGGGIVIVPALLFLLKMSEMEAIATSLAALVPPVGILGAFAYYQRGYIRVGSALLIAAGLFAGAYFGARITVSLDSLLVRRLYAVFLVAVGVKMLISGK